MPDEDREDSEYQPRWNELITLQEAAKFSGLSYSHVRHLARKKEIWAKKLGRDWFTTEKAVQEYLARDRRPGPKSK
jgi:excisionase family DNA binding protein